MARLRTFVHVNGEVYGPGRDVPAEVAPLITNPDAWDEPPTQVASGEEKAIVEETEPSKSAKPAQRARRSG